MKWNIAQARRKFSEMIHRVSEEPQVIYNRDTVVAIVVSPEQYKEYKSYGEKVGRDSLATIFNDLRELCNEEDYQIQVPGRINREVQWSQ